jgi:hypothetical protein
MPYLTQVEVIELLPLPCSGSYGFATGQCTACETASFSLWVIGPLATPVDFRLHASLSGAANPIYAILDSLLGSHIFAHFCYLTVFIPQ